MVHSSAEILFVGREAEQTKFLTAMTDAFGVRDVDPTIFLLQGGGGMGKTALAKRFVNMLASEKPFAGKHQLLWIDWADEAKKYPALQTTMGQVDPSLVFRIMRAAAGRHRWGKQFKLYNEALKQQASADREVMAAILARADQGRDFGALESATADVIASIVRARLPITRHGEELVRNFAHVGMSVTIDQAQRLRGVLENTIRAKLKPELLDHFLNPLEQQANAIGRGLDIVATKTPLVVVMDSYETIDRSDIWLRDIMRTAGSNVIWVLAGRNTLLKSRRFGDEYFKGYESDFSATLHPMTLERFDTEMIGGYFAQRVPERPLRLGELEQIAAATRGIPLAVHESAEIWQTNAPIDEIIGEVGSETSSTQIVQDMTDSYLRHVVADHDRQILYALALARGDVDVLRAMLAPENDEYFDLDDLLRRLERDYASVHARKARLHEEPERFLINHLRSDVRRSSPEIRRLNAKAVQVLEARWEAWNTEMPLIEERAGDSDWVQTALDIADHHFWLGSRAGWKFMIPRFVEAWAYSTDLLSGLLRVGRDWYDFWAHNERKLLEVLFLVKANNPHEAHNLLRSIDRLAELGWLNGDGVEERRAILNLRWGQYHLFMEASEEAQGRLESVEPLLPVTSRTLRNELSTALEQLGAKMTSEQGVSAETETIITRITKISPQRQQGWYQLALQKERMGDLPAARSAYERAL
ncbi:MAG: hypothetical protein ACPG8W_25795, partial [Candidatus Promineifilaceae bacterium]